MLKVRLEFKLADCWVGAYWRSTYCVGHPKTWMERNGDQQGWFRGTWDLWVCIIPCLPLHVTWVSERNYSF